MVRFWRNFLWSFLGFLLVLWHHFQLCQEPPCPPRLQKGSKGHWESWQGSRYSILMKLSGKLPMGCPSPLTPFPTLSGTSMSSKTPGRDLKDMGSLDRVQDVWSSWNFQGSFIGVALAPWHHFQLCQEPPCPPRLQEETWRTWGVLTGFKMFDLHETFREAS